MHVYLYFPWMCVGATHMWKSVNSAWQLVLSFHCVGFWDWNKAVRLNCRCLYPQSHPPSPRWQLCKTWYFNSNQQNFERLVRSSLLTRGGRDVSQIAAHRSAWQMDEPSSTNLKTNPRKVIPSLLLTQSPPVHTFPNSSRPHDVTESHRVSRQRALTGRTSHLP